MPRPRNHVGTGRVLVSVGVSGLLLLVLVTLVALEGNEVVLVRTRGAQGQMRQTRTWVADADGDTWVEAASTTRPFLNDVRQRPEVELRRGGTLLQCVATIEPNPGGHERIRHMLAKRYGWADRWVGLLTDTSASVAVRLRCRRTPASAQPEGW